MGASQGDFIPLLWSLGILFLLGGVILPIVSAYNSDELQNDVSSYSSVANTVENGFSIDIPLFTEFSFNPFALIPSSARQFIADDIRAFNYLPSLLSVPLIIFISISLLYSVVKIFQGFIP